VLYTIRGLCYIVSLLSILGYTCFRALGLHLIIRDIDYCRAIPYDIAIRYDRYIHYYMATRYYKAIPYYGAVPYYTAIPYYSIGLYPIIELCYDILYLWLLCIMGLYLL